MTATAPLIGASNGSYNAIYRNHNPGQLVLWRLFYKSNNLAWNEPVLERNLLEFLRLVNAAFGHGRPGWPKRVHTLTHKITIRTYLEQPARSLLSKKGELSFNTFLSCSDNCFYVMCHISTTLKNLHLAHCSIEGSNTDLPKTSHFNSTLSRSAMVGSTSMFCTAASLI